jgi:putative oxidoreductase
MSTFSLSLMEFQSHGLLFLRACIGFIFLYHSTPKLQGKMGLFMKFIGVCELIGGLAVIVGWLTQLAAMGLGIIMLGAIWKKKHEWHVPFASQEKTGWEFDLMILGGCVALIVTGAGEMAIEAVCPWLS